MGDGLAVEGPISALLLLMTGREAALDELTGHGVGALAGGTNDSRRKR
jgi:hypothetical protein